MTQATSNPKPAGSARKIWTVWLLLALFYGAVLAWHQPLRGPLTEAEVRTAFGENFDAIQSGVVPAGARLADFFLEDDGRPFYMINLNAPATSDEAAAEALIYGQFMLPRLLSRASYPVASLGVITGLTNSLGAGADDFDDLIVVRYRSRRDLLEVIATPEFREAATHKAASLEGWVSAPASGSAGVSLPLYLLLVLLAIGSVWTVVRSREVSGR
ncbi:MAG: hypothetical protein AAFU41_04735 [Pseudomonadota bacterium]